MSVGILQIGGDEPSTWAQSQMALDSQYLILEWLDKVVDMIETYREPGSLRVSLQNGKCLREEDVLWCRVQYFLVLQLGQKIGDLSSHW